MPSFIESFRASKHGGNAFIILQLIREWDGALPPTRDELAELVGITPRQAERHLERLEADGVIVTNHARGRGQKTRYTSSVNMTFTSDKSLTKTSDLPVTESRKETSDIPVNMTETSCLSDVKAEENVSNKPPISDTSDSFKRGMKVAPYKAETIKKNINTQPTVEAGATAPRHAGKAVSALSKLPKAEQEILQAWRLVTKRYPLEAVWPFILSRLEKDFDVERLKRCGGAYLAHYGFGQQHVAGICDWYAENRTEANNGKVATHSRFSGKQSPTRDLSIFPSADEGDGGDPDADHRSDSRRHGMESSAGERAEHRHHRVV